MPLPPPPAAMSSTAPWDAARVARCARLSSLAYASDVAAAAAAQPMPAGVVDAEPIRVTSRGRTLPSADVWRASATGEVIVAFRGSSTLADLRVTTATRLLPLPLPLRGGQGQGHAHAGCLAHWADMGDAVADAVRAQRARLPLPDGADARLVLTGHSLGGMMAVLAAVLLPDDLVVPPLRRSCVTFGAPRVGDAAFADVFRIAVEDGVRVVFDRDPIPRYPCDPAYRHAGDLAWYRGARADAGGRVRVRAAAAVVSPFATATAQKWGGSGRRGVRCGCAGGGLVACIGCIGCACGVRDALLDATDHRTAGYITIAERLQRGTVAVEALPGPAWWRGRWLTPWRPDT